MTSDNLRLHRDDLILTKQWLPEGSTASGILLQHSETLPRVFADVVKAPAGCSIHVGDFIAFPRYAGEAVDLDDGRFHFLNVADVEAIIDVREGL